MTMATILSMIIGELVPKNMALAVPLVTAKIVAPFQLAFSAVFRPIVSLLNGSANAVLRAIGIEPQEELSGARSAEELSSLVRRSAMAGMLEEDTATLLDRSLTFARLECVGRDDAAPAHARPGRRRFGSRDDPSRRVRTGHSRFPLYGESLDDISSIVHLKAAIGRAAREAIRGCLVTGSEPLRVPRRSGSIS